MVYHDGFLVIVGYPREKVVLVFFEDFFLLHRAPRPR
jgi:hypothetical protein